MSTPQDPRYGQGNDQGNGQSPYGQQGRPGPYGGQDDGGRYGYQAAQPSGYAYPGGGTLPQQAEKGPAPREVQRAYVLILAAGVLYLASAIISALTSEVPDMAGASLGVGIGLVFSVVFAAVYVVLAVFIRKGHNWARITATVLAALNVLGLLASFLLLPLAGQAAEASGQSVAAPSGLSLALSVIVTLLGVAGVVLTYLVPARPYFAPRRLGY
ncbi:hypothetical protein [Arthrobacter sp. NPDC092385]|uniref:hypothetical protein n=1 Tax=Arthrobacter sp. NPDC092385 TaxID=3363943 RepID=UPI0037F1A425